jgi:glycosyltransferase involved in cell wall biosynthesis
MTDDQHAARDEAGEEPSAVVPRHNSIALVMIVKNEAKIIGRLAASVRPLIDYWVICDTGSSDGTPQVAREVFADVPGELHEDEWVDMATNRSRALVAARGKADYLLLLDCDQTLLIAGELPPLSLDCYELKLNEDWVHWLPKLVRGDLPWCYRGSAHEYLDLDPPGTPWTRDRLRQIVVEHHADGGERRRKWTRGRTLLEKDLAADPDDPRTVFYLANTYRDMGRVRDAIRFYRRRIELGGWEEEVFWSRYQLGLLLERSNSDKAVTTLMEAWEYRPTRAEPLFELARIHRERQRYSLAYLFATRGVGIPYPEDEILFVIKWIYDWGLKFEWSVAAYWVGDVANALKVNEHLLTRDDVGPRYREAVIHNLEWCLRKLAERPTGA